jgi:hypothetical protein
MAYLGAVGGAGQGLIVDSSGVPKWKSAGQSVYTAYDLDFGTVGTETILSTTGTATRTYGGVTWTFQQVGAGSMATSTSGLTMTMNSGSECYIRAGQTQFGINDMIQGNYRLWLYQSQYQKNGTSNISGWYMPFAISTSKAVCMRQFNSTNNKFLYLYPSSTEALYEPSGTDPNYTVFVAECQGGVVTYRVGTWSSGWPTLSSCIPYVVCTWPNTAAGTAQDASAIQTNFYSNGATNVNIYKNLKIEVW